MTILTCLGRTVRRDGEVVAELTYGSSMITVSAGGKVIGRLYRSGVPGQRYDVWTALHPAVPTPSDARLERDLPLTDAVGLLLERPGSTADDEGDSHDE